MIDRSPPFGVKNGYGVAGCRAPVERGGTPTSNFSLEILEYCDESEALKREQYYLDLCEPEYNILKIAGSRLNSKHSEETIAKI